MSGLGKLVVWLLQLKHEYWLQSESPESTAEVCGGGGGGGTDDQGCTGVVWVGGHGSEWFGVE